MNKKILLAGVACFVLLGANRLHAQGHCTAANLWVNGSLENATVGNQCTQFNPVNAYTNTSYPFFGYTTFTYIGSGPAIQSNFVNEPMADHTTGLASGHYLYMDPRNSSGSTYQVRQDIKVKPSTIYTFSVWVSSMLKGSLASSPATIQLMVNGTTVSTPLTVTDTSINWIQLSGTWNSGSSTTATASINAINTQVGGHDFALDDMFFGAGELVADAGNNATVCINAQHTLGGAPTASYGATCGDQYTYSWTPTTGFTTASNIANPVIQPAMPGNYTYFVTITDLNGQTCQDSVKIKVGCDTIKSCTVNNLWVNGTFENMQVANHCDIFNPINAYANISAPFFGFTTFTYVGSGPAIQPGVLNEPQADHTIGGESGHYLYVDPRDASGSAYQIRQNIKVKPNTTYDFSAWITSTLTTSYASSPAQVQLVINGSPVSAVLTAGGTATNWIQISGTWNSGTSTTAVADIVAINPSIGGHDFAIDDIVFGAGNIEVDAGKDTVICDSVMYTLGGLPTAAFGATCNGEYTYNWSPTTGFTTASNIAHPQIFITTPGVYTYTVTVQDLNGQSCQDAVKITVKDCNHGLGINSDNGESSSIILYPNPTSGRLNISIKQFSVSYQFTMFDYTGRMKLNTKLTGSDTEINMSDFANSVYFYQIKDSNGNVIRSGSIVKK